MEDTVHKLLTSYVGNKVLIVIKGDIAIRGKLKTFDQHLNIVLDDAEEIRVSGDNRKIGETIIRGDTVMVISPVKE